MSQPITTIEELRELANNDEGEHQSLIRNNPDGRHPLRAAGAAGGGED
jgi:hypothetical protein